MISSSDGMVWWSYGCPLLNTQGTPTWSWIYWHHKKNMVSVGCINILGGRDDDSSTLVVFDMFDPFRALGPWRFCFLVRDISLLPWLFDKVDKNSKTETLIPGTSDLYMGYIITYIIGVNNQNTSCWILLWTPFADCKLNILLIAYTCDSWPCAFAPPKYCWMPTDVSSLMFT